MKGRVIRIALQLDQSSDRNAMDKLLPLAEWQRLNLSDNGGEDLRVPTRVRQLNPFPGPVRPDLMCIAELQLATHHQHPHANDARCHSPRGLHGPVEPILRQLLHSDKNDREPAAMSTSRSSC